MRDTMAQACSTLCDEWLPEPHSTYEYLKFVDLDNTHTNPRLLVYVHTYSPCYQIWEPACSVHLQAGGVWQQPRYSSVRRWGFRGPQSSFHPLRPSERIASVGSRCCRRWDGSSLQQLRGRTAGISMVHICIPQMYHTIVSYNSHTFITHTYHTNVSHTSKCHTNVLHKCITQMYHTKLSQNVFAEMYHMKVLDKCITQTYHTNISHKHITQTYHTNISHKHITQMYYTNEMYPTNLFPFNILFSDYPRSQWTTRGSRIQKKCNTKARNNMKINIYSKMWIIHNTAVSHKVSHAITHVSHKCLALPLLKPFELDPVFILQSIKSIR